MKNKELVKVLLLLLVLILLIVFMPFAVIWALNTLFVMLAIPYNFYTWAAVVILNLTWMSKHIKVNK